MWHRSLLAAAVVGAVVVSAHAQSRSDELASSSRRGDEGRASLRDDFNAWSRRPDAQGGMFRSDGSSNVRLPQATSVRERIDQIRQANAISRTEGAARAAPRSDPARRDAGEPRYTQAGRAAQGVSAAPITAPVVNATTLESPSSRNAARFEPVARAGTSDRADRSSYADRGSSNMGWRNASSDYQRGGEHSSSKVAVAGSFSYSSGYYEPAYVAPRPVYTERFTTASAWTGHYGGGVTYVQEPAYAGGLRQVYYPNRYGPFYEPAYRPVYAPVYCPPPVVRCAPTYYYSPAYYPCRPAYYGRPYYPGGSGFSVSVWGRF